MSPSFGQTPSVCPSERLSALRDLIRRLERPSGRPADALPFGVVAIDRHLPGGGLVRGALHEVSGGGSDDVHAAGAALFVAGILARLPGPVLWCATARDLFAPGLAYAGLHPDRLLHVCAPDDTATLIVMEEAVRHGGLTAVVCEVEKLSMTASRRLKLAAEKSGTMALALGRRREGRPAQGSLTAAATRWRISPLPSTPLAAGIGRARWRVELTRCRGGETATWIMGACDAQGRLAVPAELADRPAAQAGRRAA